MILHIFFRSKPPEHPTMILPSALSIILICGVTVRRNFRPPMETFCVRHGMQILILFENSLSFKILCFSLALSSQHSAPKVRRVARNLQWGGGLFWGSGSEIPRRRRLGVWKQSPQPPEARGFGGGAPSARKFCIFLQN